MSTSSTADVCSHESPQRQSSPLRGLLIAQFFGAFNDNAWKFVVALLGFGAIQVGITDASQVEAASQTQTTLAFVVFTLPLMLFSLPAGLIADRISKRSIIVAMKLVEVLLMLAAAFVLALAPQGGTAALVVLGLMGLQSAIFSPAKYGILPELLPHDRLSQANGKLETFTFLAIVSGTAGGGALLSFVGTEVWIVGAVLTLLALFGYLASLRIPRLRAAATLGGAGTQQAPGGSTLGGAWKAIRSDRVLCLTVIGQCLFWGFASLVSQDLLVYSKVVLGLDNASVGLPLALLVVGIGLGSMLAGRVSHGKVEVGLIPLAALLLAGSTLLLGFFAPGLILTLVLLLPLGIASGLLLVPLDALLQWRAPAARRGAVIAVTNVFVFAGVLAGSLGAEAMSRMGLSSSGILLGTAVIMFAATVWAICLLPVAFLRMLAVVLTSTFYRQSLSGRENLPETGAALLVPNHVSFIDGILIAVTTDRPIRFVVDASFFEKRGIGAFLRVIGAIPLSTAHGPKATLRSLRQAGEALERGELVCIFAEGQITRTGSMQPFKRGIERILQGRDAPIIPVALHGLWGSIFSFEAGRFLWKLPRRLPYPLSVSFGRALPATTPMSDVRQAIMELDADAAMAQALRGETLQRAFLRSARRRPWRFAMSDAAGGQGQRRLTRLRSAAAAIGFARVLRPAWGQQEKVGILLPPSIPAALINFAAALSGRVSVNLNYSSGQHGIASAIRQAGLRSVVTSRAFLDKAGLELEGVELIEVEELVPQIGLGARALALLLACCVPQRFVERACGARRKSHAADLATVIFSSGSTGEPKGVMLSHANVMSNLEAVAQVFRFHQRDRLLGILPLFHSFGYLTAWIAACEGLGIAYAPNPLDAAGIGKLVQQEQLTVLIATPTFLQLFMKRCTPEQFASLRLVVTGAEKLQEHTARAFEDRFGIRPLEGYGTTECSPVIAASTLDYRAPGFYQVAARRAHAGQVLPGIALRVVDPESFVPLPAGDSGMLLVRGPNVMQGYLGQPELTASVMHDGCYVTGDIGSLDAEGFLQITDRLSRFSKIGGEMVSHGKVERVLQQAAASGQRLFAVSSLPDAKKGERLAVLTILAAERLPEVLERAACTGLPKLFLPKLADFIHVDSLPMLGSGKLDLAAVKQFVRAATRPATTLS